MIRASDPVWQQCLRAVEPVLESLGFGLAREVHHYALFGSASAEYERAGMRLELFWDGREHWISIRYAIGDRQSRGNWGERRPLEIPPPSSSVNAHYLRRGPGRRIHREHRQRCARPRDRTAVVEVIECAVQPVGWSRRRSAAMASCEASAAAAETEIV